MSVGLDMHHTFLKDLVENMLSYQHMMQSVVAGLDSRLATLEALAARNDVRSVTPDVGENVAEAVQTETKDADSSGSLAAPAYEFGRNIWDASLFIGFEQFGIGGSMLLFFLLMLNIAMQSVYTIICVLEFTKTNFDDETIAGYQEFRVRLAHDIKYLDPITHASLVAKVCLGGSALEVAGQQLEALRVIDGYLSNDEIGESTVFGDKLGQMMCWLACITWTMVVAQEVKSSVQLAVAVSKHVKDNGIQHKTNLRQSDETWHIASLCMRGLILMMGVVTLRLVLAIFLLLSGLLFLVHTIDLSELVLNAVALECVLNLDELIFEAFAPADVGTFLDSLEGLPCPQWCFRSGVDMHAFLSLLASAGLLMYLIPPWLSSEVQRLEDARLALCGGDRHFVIASTNFAPWYTWSATPKADGRSRNAFAESLTTSIIVGDPAPQAETLQQSRISGTTWSVKTESEWSIMAASMKWNGLCNDIFDTIGVHAGFHEALIFYNSEGASSCPEMRTFCDEDSPRGTAARGICPVTCGCDRPDSSLVMSDMSVGCPQTCEKLDVYQNVLATVNPNCIDRSLEDLQADPIWNYFAKQVYAIALTSNWKVHPMLEGYSDNLQKHGCTAVDIIRKQPRFFPFDPCDESDQRSYPFKSVRLFCPASCNCTSSRRNCPKSCPAA